MSQQPGPLTIGFDIGGTNLRGAVVNGRGQIIDSAHVPTPDSPKGLEEGISFVVKQLRANYDVDAVGLAIAGFLDPECTMVRFAPHLAWRDAPVKEILEDHLALPVRLEHDANAAAWGEYRFGAAKDASVWALFAIGTGIGGALMINGEIYRGAFGTAPEFGHLTVVPEGRECACGKRGCLERYCSGTALEHTAKELMDSGAFGEYPPGRMTGRMVMAEAKKGDPMALAAVEQFATGLGEGLSIVADVLDPELIVIGGGVSTDAALYLDMARKEFAQRIVGSGHRPMARLSTVELGADAGMIGVADLARQLTV